MNWTSAQMVLTDALARGIRRVPRGAAAVRAACQTTLLRRAGAGALAIAYARTLTNAELRIADLGDYRLNVNVAEWSGACAYFFAQPGVSWITEHLVGKGNVCLDVGANIGLYTNFLAHRAGPTGMTIAFEPNPILAAPLRKSLVLNGFDGYAEVESRAAWNRGGQTLELHLSDDPHNSGISSLVQHGHFVAKIPPRVSVQTVTLDEVLAERKIERCHFCKVDVERAEFEVVRGLNHALRDHRVDFLLIEMLAGSEAQSELRSHGYEGWLVSSERDRALHRLGDVEQATFGDFVFVRPELIEGFRRSTGAPA